MVYPSAIPLDGDILQPQQSAMIGIGYGLEAHVGKTTCFFGLTCTPTSPASMAVVVGPGAVISPNVVETTPFGSLPADTTDPLVKMGINLGSTPFAIVAPTTAGQSQNYLIQCAFSEADDTPQTLTYYNSLNPNQPYSGPANSGTPQNTRRAQRANLQLKVGVPASTGTQITPPVDAGWNGLYVITVNNGQTAITAGSISIYPNAPFLVPFLASHHGGIPGQAPRINLATEVQGVLPAANLPSAIGSSFVFSGNPNGNVAGTAASGSTPPVLCWDTLHNMWWTCVTTGNSANARWVQATNAKNVQIFTSSSSFVVPPGITKLHVTCVGAGGSGAGTSATASTTVSAAAGGNAGCIGLGLYDVTPGQTIPITIGGGGVWNISGNSTNGGTSSVGSFISSPGGQGAGVNVPAYLPPLTQSGAAVSLKSTGGYMNAPETAGYPSIVMLINNFISGAGGDCGNFGSGGSSIASTSLNGAVGQGYGGGGSGGCTGPSQSAKAGGPGANGVVILEW